MKKNSMNFKSSRYIGIANDFNDLDTFKLNLKKIVSHLLEIAPISFRNNNDKVNFISKSLNFAVLDSLEVYSKLNFEQFRLVSRVFNAYYMKNKKYANQLNDEILSLGYNNYIDSCKIRKTAAILPDPAFVSGLVDNAYQTLKKCKPRNVSKFLAGLIHSSFFDYAFDRNIFLAATFYNMLREKYGKSMKEDLGIDEIKYYASNKIDQKLTNVIENNIDKDLNTIYTQASALYPTSSAENLCDRILLLTDVMGVKNESLEKMAKFLTSKTGLTFELSNCE